MTKTSPQLTWCTVRFGEDTYEAKALEGRIDPGTEVEIVLIEDNRIYVRPL